MATKTDRILSYLPGTFRALLPFTGQPSALYAIADAAGRELQLGENKLAQVMLSHWVDTADRNAEEIVDLAKIAALYGLAPQDEEELEEFRRHLKRYIRTFLEGTVTVQGILRVAAEALGLEIADSYEDLDTWWKRATPAEIVTTWDADDAAEHVLGFPYGVDHGQPANPARVQGIPNLAQGVDLQADSVLYLQVDGAETQTVHLIPLGEEPHATLEQLVARINSVFEPLIGHSVASVKDNHLVITSPSTGPSSRLEFEEGSGEVGDLILGLPPLTYFGKPAQAALITGTVDLSGDLDLNQTRYLRLSIDGAQPQEVDCGGSTPGHRTVEDVRDDINTVFEMDIASVEEWEDQKYLRLSSPTTGPLSSIAFLQAPAQDAAARLFGPHNPVYLGADEAPAEVFSLEHPPEGVDLSVRHNLRLSIDDSVPITINCAGLRPHETQLTEIANAINAAFSPTIGGEIARRVGRRIRLISPSTGEFSQIRFETPDEADATELIFGLPPRTRRGSAPTSARLVGKKEIDEVNLLARHLLRVRVDGMPAVIVDLRQGVENPRMAILQDLVHALEAQLGDDTATDDGLHLILASPTYGSGSSLEILPLEIVSRQRYVSRAHLTGEAAEAILGVHQAKVFGHAATRARLVGTPDLSRGVDLRSASYLRLSVDGQPFRDIQCAGPRPRATLLDEIVQAINKEWDPILDSEVAFSDGRKLILASPTEGAQSSLRFEPPQVYDALDNLLDLPAGSVRGTAATGVTLIGLPDLSEGVDLPAQADIKVGLDGSAPIEIPLTGDDPAHLSLVDLVVAISLQLGSGVASQDGQHLIMASSKVGVEAQLELETPDGNDATPALFGFSAPRKYQGNDAKPAVLQGKVNLSGTQDLSLARFLRIGVDGKAPVDVDCAAEDASNTELADIAARINAALKADVAFPEGDFLRLQSPSTGSSSRLLLERYTAGDARTLLLGENVPEETRGEAPKPATLTGTVSLTSPADLSRRSVMRIAVDGGRPFDVDVHGSTPESTLLNEIVTKINDVSPGLASAVEIDQLRLTSPSAGPASSIEVLPLRSIELIEYLPKPPQPDGNLHRQVRHGEAWNVDNPGAGETFTEVSFITPSGAAGPMLVNETIGWRVGLVTTFRPGEGARIWSDLRHGLLAERVDAEGNRSPIPPGEISAAPLGGSALVPFPQEVEKWLLTGSSQGAASLTLDNPLAPRILVLHSFVSTPAQPEISVQVVEAKTSDNGTLPALPGDGSHARTVGRLVWVQGEWLLYQAGEPVARVRNGVAGGLTDFQDRVVAAQGPYFAAEPPESLPLLIVEQVDCLFDVTISDHTGERVESFSGVTIGSPESDSFGLAWKVNAGENSSLLVRADVLEKAGVLRLPRGRSRFRYLDCLVDRFNRCVFGGKNFSGGAHFAGGECRRRSRFNLSRFTYSPPEKEVAVFDSALPYDALPVEVSFSWTSHMPGAMQVRLPADLPSRFGGVFNQARFSRRSTLPELFENAVTEPAPADEPRHIKNLINDETDGSQLVVANVVPDVPIGWTAQMIPFRKPRHLTLGSEETPARIYLQDPDVPVFIELRARSEGDWGNAVSVAMRKSGPAMFDVSVAYNGSRFDSAREAVAGPELPELVLDILKPAPVGVRLAKAAGIHGEVTRGGVEHAI